MALFYFLPAAVAIVATGAGCYGVRRALSSYWPDAKSEKSAFFIAWFAASFVVSCKLPVFVGSLVPILLFCAWCYLHWLLSLCGWLSPSSHSLPLLPR